MLPCDLQFMCKHFQLTCVEIRFCCKLQQFCCSCNSSFRHAKILFQKIIQFNINPVNKQIIPFVYIVPFFVLRSKLRQIIPSSCSSSAEQLSGTLIPYIHYIVDIVNIWLLRASDSKFVCRF